ncbi:glycosyltransferase family 2 protein [Candidatus Microgenomates bacterium]|jgi:glycosyltransferase involved in cell wall biosynthesis|nr:MAG: glycosyltransferase family 2 protein [Candidatus Microgenomates bacterium]
MKISAVVLAKNEEKNIKECLDGLKWCDEIIVIDDDSVDKTAAIAKKQGAKVFKRQLEADFASQRNFGLQKASHDWIFFVDADERVGEDLAEEIKARLNQGSLPSGFFIKRIDFFGGKFLKYGETDSIKLLRLARRGSGEWKRAVDETWEIGGEKSELKSPLRHYSHLSLTDFLTSINERSTLNARVFYNEGKRVTFFEWLKPAAKFIRNYFFNLGFLDGTAGFVFAVLMSLHSFLVRGKLYLIWRREGGWK